MEKVLQSIGFFGLPRPLVADLVRRELAALRQSEEAVDFTSVLSRVNRALQKLRLSRIQPVINGTGILVHTNLGRSPLAAEAARALADIASHYNNLEIDLSAGERGGRAEYLERCLALLCGSEAATVVNNCAAALVLILRHFTSGARKEVIISRGELVQIGGGFRIPEILEASGAQLREIGTTNKTTLQDYERALSDQAALILKVHQSNFYMGGFVEVPSTEDIARLASRHQLPLVEDLGSGAVVKTERFPGVDHEPTPMEILSQGVDVACFSGDKLFGGPQAGILAGKARLIESIKKEPFFRALRCDKLIMAALQTTAELYLSKSAEESNPSEEPIPVLAMMQIDGATLRPRIERIVAALEGLPIQASLGESVSQIGGGTLPKSGLPSMTLDLVPKSVSLAEFAARLRRGTPPVVGYIAQDRLRLDFRTVFARQDEALLQAIRSALQEDGPPAAWKK